MVKKMHENVKEKRKQRLLNESIYIYSKISKKLTFLLQ